MKRTVLIVLGLVIAAGGRGVFAEEAASVPATQGAGIVVDSPREWEVFQRTSLNAGMMHVAGKIGKVVGKTTVIHVRADWLGPVNSPTIWGDTRVTAETDGSFSINLECRAGGWDRVTIETEVDAKVTGWTSVNHVGVGEVFVVGGQSNSTNWGEVKTKSETAMVTVFDGKGWTVAEDPLPGVDTGQGKGSPWCTFGDLLYKRLGVPIGIVPVGKGSTSVRQWLPKGDVVAIEPTRTYGLKKNSDGKWESEGTLFDRMVERMKELGPKGFRAMLWHQGESDAHQSAGHTLPGKEYRADLERVIGESRKEVGWEVPWFVATATWGSPTSAEDPDIRSAQAGVVADGFAMAGPDTDKLIGENRQKNGTGVHMSEKGLRAHGGLWAEVVGTWVEGMESK